MRATPIGKGNWMYLQFPRWAVVVLLLAVLGGLAWVFVPSYMSFPSGNEPEGLPAWAAPTKSELKEQDQASAKVQRDLEKKKPPAVQPMNKIATFPSGKVKVLWVGRISIIGEIVSAPGDLSLVIKKATHLYYKDRCYRIGESRVLVIGSTEIRTSGLPAKANGATVALVVPI